VATWAQQALVAWDGSNPERSHLWLGPVLKCRMQADVAWAGFKYSTAIATIFLWDGSERGKKKKWSVLEQAMAFLG
jgi:hypothetical protein